jgi:hypothetical protein
LGDKYAAYGIGTYTAAPYSSVWSKQGAAVAASQNTGTASNQSILDRAAAARQQQVADETAAEQRKTRPSGNNPLEGTTWIQTDGKGYQVLSFHSPLNIDNKNNAPVMVLRTGDNIDFGNYTVSGDKVTISIGNRTGTISGNVITFPSWTFTQYGGLTPIVMAPGSGGNSNPLVGTRWRQTSGGDNLILTFTSLTNMIFDDDGEISRGTYTISGNNVILTSEDEEDDELIGTLSGNVITFANGKVTFTKQ